MQYCIIKTFLRANSLQSCRYAPVQLYQSRNGSIEGTYTVPCAEFHFIHQHIQPELIGIIKGKTNSNLHNIYWHGSKSEKSNIRLHDNFGPSKLLPDHLVSHE